MTPPRSSLSRRLVAAALVWLAVLLAVGGAVLSLAFRDSVEQEFTQRLEAELRALTAATEIAPDGTVALVRPLGDPRFERIFSGWYWQVTEPSGRQLRSRSLWDSAIAPAGDHVRKVTGPKGETLLAVEQDLQFPDASGAVHLLIAADLGETGARVRRFDLLLAAALGLLGAGMAVAVVIQVRFGLRPLRAMAADLDAVRQGEQARLNGRYPQEVAPLAEAMNAVLDSDAELIERARTHVGNLAHGLKTPLAVMQAELGGSGDGRQPVLSEQIQLMRRLIEHHLGRASAVAGAGRVLGSKVAVAESARAIAAVLQKVFADRTVSIVVEADETAAFRGHREDLEEILGNLMENACKWAATSVRLQARVEDGALLILVEDDGPGLPPEQAQAAARRGSRLDEMAPGWGLGLSIVSDLVAVNGGKLEFLRSPLGGLAVSLRLPAAPRERPHTPLPIC